MKIALGLFGSFVLPLGAPDLSLAHIYGLSLIKGLIIYRYRPTPENSSFAAQFIELLTILLLAWGVGAVAHSFL